MSTIIGHRKGLIVDGESLLLSAPKAVSYKEKKKRVGFIIHCYPFLFARE